jgi:N-dimethylarginine dimethylaminohydrolase
MPETEAPAHGARVVRSRHYLMCPPTFFDVTYSINPWMDVAKPVDTSLAVTQWERLRDVYRDLGHQVTEMTPVEGLPDMVFTANGATVLDDSVVLVAKFRYPQRAAEAQAHDDWFREHGYRDVRRPRFVNEGAGDYLAAGGRILAGTGFRTDPRSHAELQQLTGRQVVSLTLVDPHYYHLDTAIAVLNEDHVMYLPEAFAPAGQKVLRTLYPNAILATTADAAVFGLNAVSDGRNVVLPQAATHLSAELRAQGYHVIGVDVSEIGKAGGAVRCCTLDLATPWPQPPVQ